jgi:hypothetical protein
VAQPVHHLAQRAAGGGGERAGGVAQIMDTQALDTGRPDGRLPDATVEVAAPQVLTLAAQEHERVGGTWVSQKANNTVS